MNSRSSAAKRWARLRRELEQSQGQSVRVPRSSIPHPRDAGARPTATWPVGQRADHSLQGLCGQAPLVVREFDDQYEAFVDGARMAVGAAQIADASPRAAAYLGSALLGGALGSAVSNKREGALIGAGLGLLLAAAIDASTDD